MPFLFLLTETEEGGCRGGGALAGGPGDTAAAGETGKIGRRPRRIDSPAHLGRKQLEEAPT